MSGASLLERDDALAELMRALAAAAGGAGCTVLVSGEAGIGKTALLECFAATASARRVFWGSCDALFTPTPLGPLRDIARVMGGAVSELLAQGAAREAVFAACLAELERTPAPTLVVIEDVHWADEATLDLLKFLGRRVVRLPAVIALSHRDDEIDAAHPLRSLLGTLPVTAVRRVPLRPLTRGAVGRLAAAAGRDAASLYEITAGNPFFVTELLAAAPGAVPHSVRDAVLARAARLSGPARDVLEAVAVVPGQTEHWLLDALVGDDRPAVDAGVAAGVLKELARDRAIAYRHELGRLAIEQSLAPERARLWHRRVLAALEQHGKPWNVSYTRMVHHAERAGDAAAVRRLAPRAAESAAAVGAHREAAAHYATALDFAGDLPDERRAALFDRRAYECYLTNQHAGAIAAQLQALAIWRRAGDRVREGAALRWLSRLSWFLALKEDADRYAAEAIGILEAEPPGPELAMAYSNRSQLHMLAWEADEALAWGAKAIALARRVGDPEILAHALNNVGTVRAIQLGEEPAELRESLTLALRHGLQEHVARAYTNLACSRTITRDPSGLALLDEGIGYAEDRDLDAWVLYLRAWRARWWVDHGDLRQATEEGDAVLGHPSSAVVNRVPALAAAGLARVRLGAPGAAAQLEEGRALARQTGEVQRLAPVALALAEAAWLRLDDGAALRELDEPWALLRRRTEPWMRGEVALWRWRAGDHGVRPDGLPAPFALEIAGEPLKAAEAWRRLGARYDMAIALALSDERRAWREALQLLEQLGATGALAGIRARLKARGTTGIPRGARRTTRANPAGLTNRQLDILRLLAEGRSNPEIAGVLSLSPRTIDHHVSAILAKLNATSRSEATALAIKHGWDRVLS